MDLTSHNEICIMDLPTVIMDEIFIFLSITHYLCNLMLVCKQWNIENMDGMINKTYLIRQLIYNSCKHTLCYVNKIKNTHVHLLTAYDLIHEYELSAAFTSYASYMSYNTQTDNPFRIPALSLYSNIRSERLPKYSLYFDLDNKMSKIKSFHYLFDFIYLAHFGKRDEENLHKLCGLLMCLSVNGGALCIGFMLDLLLEKYVVNTPFDFKNQGKCLNNRFWWHFQKIFEMYFKHYPFYMKNKPSWVIIQNCYHFLQAGERYLQCWDYGYPICEIKPWVTWAKELRTQPKTHTLCHIVLNRY